MATAAHDQALAELAATDAMNQLRSYNAQTQQQKSPFLLSTPEKPFSLITPKDIAAKVTITAQPTSDGFFVASDGKMYRSSSGNFIFQPGKIGKELQEGEQDLAASTAEVTKTPSVVDNTGPNGGRFVLQLDNTVSLDDFVDPTARGFFVAYCKDLNLDPATARVDYSQLHQAWKEVHAFADRQNKQFEQQAIAAVREAIRGWRQDQATAESAGRPGFFASVSNFVEEVFATMAAVREAQQSDQHSTEWHIANTPNDYIPGSEAIKWKYLKPAVDDAYRAAHPTLAAWGGEPHQPTAEEKARMSLLVAVAGDTAAGIWVPGYGEYQDVQVLKDPEAPTWQKGLSAVTLAGGFITAGFLPNFGTFFRPVKKAVNGADEIADATQAAAKIEMATVHAAESVVESTAGDVVRAGGSIAAPPNARPRDNGLRQTGAGFFNGSADEAYEVIRSSTTDVDAIARNTGLKAENIQKIKDHLFNDEHLLDRYVDLGFPAEWARFDSDLAIANSWKRLETGEATASDIQLLRHEMAEAHVMEKLGPSYSKAHDRAQRRYPAPPLEE